MNYPKSLLSNIFLVFFVTYLLPGIEIVDQTKLPHLGGDLPFAIVLGLLNSLIYPALKLFDRHSSLVQIGLTALILNFAAYALLKLVSIGVQIHTVEGYILASFVTTVGSFCINFLERRHCQRGAPQKPDNLPPIN